MGKVIVAWLFLFLELVLMVTPIMFYIDASNKESALVVLNEGAKRASIVGELTDDIKADMKRELKESKNYKSDDIQISSTTETGNKATRGEMIDIKMEVKRSPILMLDVFAPNTLKSTFTHKVSIMSEYQGDGQ